MKIAMKWVLAFAMALGFLTASEPAQATSTYSVYTFLAATNCGLPPGHAIYGGPVQISNFVFPDRPFSQSLECNGDWYMAVMRPSNEITVDLDPALNAYRNTIGAKLVATGGALTSRIRAQGMRWDTVPYYNNNPGAHAQNDMLVRVNFDFHHNTPWFCPAIDGTISFYIYLYLENNQLSGYVDNWDFHFNGGGACAGAAQDQLNRAVSSAASSDVPQLLQQILSLYSNQTFQKIYFLPGDGAKNPPLINEDATSDVALGLIPAR
jgi:hypothetical protein